LSEEGWEPGPTARHSALPPEADTSSLMTWTGSRDPHDDTSVRRETPTAAIPVSSAGCAGGGTADGLEGGGNMLGLGSPLVSSMRGNARPNASPRDQEGEARKKQLQYGKMPEEDDGEISKPSSPEEEDKQREERERGYRC
jgi:hypothetical protein